MEPRSSLIKFTIFASFLLVASCTGRATPTENEEKPLMEKMHAPQIDVQREKTKPGKHCFSAINPDTVPMRNRPQQGLLLTIKILSTGDLKVEVKKLKLEEFSKLYEDFAISKNLTIGHEDHEFINYPSLYDFFTEQEDDFTEALEEDDLLVTSLKNGHLDLSELEYDNRLVFKLDPKHWYFRAGEEFLWSLDDSARTPSRPYIPTGAVGRSLDNKVISVDYYHDSFNATRRNEGRALLPDCVYKYDLGVDINNGTFNTKLIIDPIIKNTGIP